MRLISLKNWVILVIQYMTYNSIRVNEHHHVFPSPAASWLCCVLLKFCHTWLLLVPLCIDSPCGVGWLGADRSLSHGSHGRRIVWAANKQWRRNNKNDSAYLLCAPRYNYSNYVYAHGIILTVYAICKSCVFLKTRRVLHCSIRINVIVTFLLNRRFIDILANVLLRQVRKQYKVLTIRNNNSHLAVGAKLLK